MKVTRGEKAGDWVAVGQTVGTDWVAVGQTRLPSGRLWVQTGLL